MTDDEILDLIINNPGIQKNLNAGKEYANGDNWQIISADNPFGIPLEFNWEFFKRTSAFSYMRAVAHFEYRARKEMFLIFHDMSWTAHTGETGHLTKDVDTNSKAWKKDLH